MTPTKFERIYDMALVTIQDYKLNSLAVQDYDAFLEFLQSILESTIPEFYGVLGSIEYDSEKAEFLSELSIQEISILSKGMVINWFARETQNVTQFNLHLNNREFKHYAESQNLKEKSEYIDRLREKYNQEITNYQLMNINKIPFFGGL